MPGPVTIADLIRDGKLLEIGCLGWRVLARITVLGVTAAAGMVTYGLGKGGFVEQERMQ